MARNSISFAFYLSYQGTTVFDCFDNGERYKLRLRSRLDDYERSQFNGGPTGQVAQEAEQVIGVLVRDSSMYPVRAEILQAFNEWRTAQHESSMAELRKRYPDLNLDSDPEFSAPMLARTSAHYQTGKGWVFADQLEPAAG